MKYPNMEAERARLGMSKDDFAKKLGIATKTYYNWINGVNPIPSDALIEISPICNADTDYLLGLSVIPHFVWFQTPFKSFKLKRGVA